MSLFQVGEGGYQPITYWVCRRVHLLLYASYWKVNGKYVRDGETEFNGSVHGNVAILTIHRIYVTRFWTTVRPPISILVQP